MSFYSVNGVDKYISELLPEFGYACDVGANDGYFLSNTKHFEDKGWIVLCIEPNPLLSETGKSHRKLWRQVACGSQSLTEVEFDIVGVYPYASCSGFHTRTAPVEMVPNMNMQYVHDAKKVKVEMATLNSELALAEFPRLDLLSIDVEGHEFDVLKGIDLIKWRPKIIVSESWSESANSEIQEYLRAYSYLLINKLEYDYCYERLVP